VAFTPLLTWNVGHYPVSPLSKFGISSTGSIGVCLKTGIHQNSIHAGH
jgi:hypothetical protein